MFTPLLRDHQQPCLLSFSCKSRSKWGRLGHNNTGLEPHTIKGKTQRKIQRVKMEKTKEEAQYEERREYNRRWENANKDPSGLRKASPLTRLHKVMQKTWNTAIPKRNSSLLSKPLVLFKGIFRG
jgi:hypothetical protein